MKHLLAILFLLVTPATIRAQNVITPTTATVVAYWEAGDTKSYTLQRTKSGHRNGSTTVRIDLKVLTGTDTSYTIECMYRDMKVLAGMPDDPKAARATEKVLKAVDGMRVVVSTSETGIFEEVLNVDEIQRHVDKILKSVADMASNVQEREEMMAAFSKVITSEALAVAAAEDIGYLLFPFGVEYTLGQLESGATDLPNPLGGDPIPAVIEMTMTKLDPATEQVSIHVDQRIDPSGMTRSFELTMERMGKSMTSEERAELEKLFKEMTVTDVVDLDVHLQGAWVRRARCTRFIRVAGRDQTDERVYDLL